MEPSDQLAILDRSAERLLSVAKDAFGRGVPSCPGWTVADLVIHIARTWGWSAAIVETGERAERADPPPGGDQETLLLWADAQLARLDAALRRADPDSDCWTFGPPRTRRFWFRRQALETALHAWDAEHAAGAASAIPGDVATDGTDEYLRVMIPRWVANHPDHGWSGETFHLHRTDGEGEWLLRLGPGPAAEVEAAHGKGDVALRGSAEALWLWCTNRQRPDEAGLEVFGDAALVERWREEIAF